MLSFIPIYSHSPQDRAPHQDPDLISLWRARSAIHTLQCAGHLDLEDDYSDMENQRPGVGAFYHLRV